MILVHRMMTRPRPPVFFAVLALCGIVCATAQIARAAGGVVAGVVTDVGGDPIARAAISLDGNGLRRTRSSDAKGAFAFADVAAGTYVLDVRAPGYERLGGRTLDVVEGRISSVSVQLVRSTSSLTTLGHVTTRAGEALSTSSSPTEELDAQAFAARGNSNVADMLSAQALSATIVRPAGGSPAAPAVVALRGPDPTETLFDVDGHSVNSGGSGAFDLSLLDAAQLSGVQIVYGIAPSSLIGPNTIGGAVNVRTLDPTPESHGLARLSFGSFSTFGGTLQATGTDANVGYAISLHRQTTRGEASQQILTAVGLTPDVGSGVSGSTGLAKVRVGIGRNGGSVLLTLRDQSAFRDLSAALSSMLTQPAAPAPTFADFSGSAQVMHNAGYGLDVSLPVGSRDEGGVSAAAVVIRHLTSIEDQSVFGPAAGVNPYLLNECDLITDDIAQFDRALADGSFSAKLDFRTESLGTQVGPGGASEQSGIRHPFGTVRAPYFAQAGVLPSVGLAQTQRSGALRYTLDSSRQLHYALAAYYSNFSSFGSSLDPRFGIVWTPTGQTSVRASVGSTFQSPQLPELYVPPVLPPPDPSGFFDIGNPNLTADRATDLGLGLDHVFAGARPARLGIDVYRVNLRNSAQRFVPSIDCTPPVGPPPPPQLCESFPINIGDAVYRGVEAKLDWYVGRSARGHATYAVNSSYPTGVPSQFRNGTLVVGEQSSGVPLQSGSVSIESASGGAFGYNASLHFEGRYNELNRPAFATLQAGVTWHADGLDVGVYGTNLTNAYDDRFTLAGRGVPYGGIDGPVATDAYSLQGRALTLVITSRY